VVFIDSDNYSLNEHLGLFMKSISSSRSAEERAARYLRKKSSITLGEYRENTSSMINVRGPVFMTPLSQKALSNRGGESTKIIYENTYKMVPNIAFPANKIKDVVERILSCELRDTQYDAENCRQLTSRISDIIKREVKDLNLERYKLVCIVHIGQRGNQEIKVGSRCLWDVRLDTYISVEYQNTSLFAIATVFGIYFE
jgi:hypothetical protein